MNFLSSIPNPLAGSAVLLAALAAAVPLHGQSGRDAATEQTRPSPQILRSIDDPALGTRWLLVGDPQHPGGPGKLVLNASLSPEAARAVRSDALVVIVRAGDRLRVEAHSPTSDTWLDGVALGPARKGSSFLARLAFGNSIVRVVATAPGRAALAPESKDESKGWAQ